MASFLAKQDAPTLAQVLLELTEDFASVYERLERLRIQDDPAALSARFNQQLQRWKNDDRFVAHQDAAAFGRELDVWVAQVQREVLPRFPGEAMALFAAFVELDRVVFEGVDDDGGYVGGVLSRKLFPHPSFTQFCDDGRPILLIDSPGEGMREGEPMRAHKYSGPP